MTASHCFVGITSPATHVRLGEHDISTTADGANTLDVAIKKYTTHEGYTSTALQNDIAIVELETPVSYRAGIRPACLPDQFGGVDFSTLKTQPTIVGWGSTVTGGTTVQALRQVSLLLLWRFMGWCTLMGSCTYSKFQMGICDNYIDWNKNYEMLCKLDEGISTEIICET